MIEKRILLDPFDKFGNPRIHLLSDKRIPGVKLAGDDIVSHMQPDMREFWNDLKIETDLYGYLLTNILGAGEMYGSNLNGDIFYAYPKEDNPTKGLRQYYKTFEHGHVFLNHDNKDPKTSVGKVLFASWNPIMMRVELLEAIEKDDPRGLKILQRVERGEFPKVSMGCRVPFDVCTICRNVARTREEYCSHLKHDMNKIYDDGSLVAAINDYPRFFDSSKVFVEADRSSGTLAKVAGKVMVEMPKKESTIEKQVTDNQIEDKDIKDRPEEVERGRSVDELDSILPKEVLDMLSGFPMPDIFGTFNDMQMKVKPQEFIYIKIRKAGGPADKMIEKNISIEPKMEDADKKEAFASGKNFNTKIAEILRPYIHGRTMLPEALKRRELSHCIFKTKPKPIEYIKNAALEREYATYIRTALNVHPSAVASTINNHPEFLNELRGDNSLQKTAGLFSEDDIKSSRAALFGALQNV